MKYILLNSEDIPWELDPNYKFEFSPLVKRTRVVDIYRGDGGIQTGDRRTSARTIRVAYNATANAVGETIADEVYIEQLTKIFTFFEDDLQPVYLIQELDNGERRRVQVDLSESQDRPINPGTDYRIGDNLAVMDMLSPFFEDEEENEVIIAGPIENEDEFEIENESSLICFPRLTITALNTVAEFVLTNVSTGQVFIFSDSTFGNGAILVADPRGIGSITVNDVSAYASLVDGSGFLFLKKGTNVFKFESPTGQVSITFNYRRRFPA
jgi:hypothetical protein